MAESLIKPELFTVTDADGNDRNFIVSNFDAVEGREIVTQWFMSALPKVGDYPTNKEMMLKIMSYVAVDINGNIQRLTTEALVNNHCGDWETLEIVEMKMMEKNCRFFQNGKAQNFFDRLTRMALEKVSEMLTISSEASSPGVQPPSTN